MIRCIRKIVQVKTIVAWLQFKTESFRPDLKGLIYLLKCIELNSKKGKTVKFTKCQFLEDIFINYVTPLEYSCGFYFTQGLDKKDLSKL